MIPPPSVGSHVPRVSGSPIVSYRPIAVSRCRLFEGSVSTTIAVYARIRCEDCNEMLSDQLGLYTRHLPPSFPRGVSSGPDAMNKTNSYPGTPRSRIPDPFCRVLRNYDTPTPWRIVHTTQLVYLSAYPPLNRRRSFSVYHQRPLDVAGRRGLSSYTRAPIPPEVLELLPYFVG